MSAVPIPPPDAAPPPADDFAVAVARARFAAFPDPLKQAMRIAAKRGGWDEATWVTQVGRLGEAMRSGAATAEGLAAAYLDSPPAA